MTKQTADIWPRVIAHRGLSHLAPENTLAAFHRAVKQGIPWIECDVQLTHDHIPIIFHDDTLARIADRPESITDIPWAILKHVDVGRKFSTAYSGEHIPTLSDLFAFMQETGCAVNLELKTEQDQAIPLAAAVMNTITQLRAATPNHLQPCLSKNILFSSFCWDALAHLRTLDSTLALGVLTEDFSEAALQTAKQLGCVSFHMDERSVTAERVHTIHAAGLKLCVYTVNDRCRAHALWQLGVDTLFSDCPERLL